MSRLLIALSAAALSLAACGRADETELGAPAAGDAGVDASASDGMAAGGGAEAAGAEAARSPADGAAAPPPPAQDGMTSQLPVERDPAAPYTGAGEPADGPTSQSLPRPDTPMPQTDPDGRPSL